jgi:hypothetical protein
LEAVTNIKDQDRIALSGETKDQGQLLTAVGTTEMEMATGQVKVSKKMVVNGQLPIT